VSQNSHKKKNMWCRVLVFNLWGMWSGNHSHEEWAKFGYMSERKVDNFSESYHVLATSRNLFFNMESFEFFSSKCGHLGLFF
jgi:hypothetical protein